MPMKDIPDPEFAGQRRRRSNTFRRILSLLVLLLVLAFFFKGRLVTVVSDVQFLTSQKVSRTVALEGILLKSENVLRAPVGGKLHLAAADGDRLKTGAIAAEILAVQQEVGGETYDIPTPVAGICCTHLDGLEQVLSPDNIDVLVFPTLEKIGDKATTEGVRVEKGQPVLKIIDNLSPVYVYIDTPKDNIPDLTINKPTWWKATWEDLALSVKPHKVLDEGDRWKGYFILSAYPDQLLHQRKVRLHITTRTLEGFLVPQRAIVNKDGKDGIFLSVKKKACWTPVTIEGELEGMLAVSGPELTGDSRYVSNPLLAREGLRVE